MVVVGMLEDVVLVSLDIIVDDIDANDIVVVIGIEVDDGDIEVGKDNFVFVVDDTLNGSDIKIVGIVVEDFDDGNRHDNEALTSLSSIFCSSLFLSSGCRFS